MGNDYMPPPPPPPPPGGQAPYGPPGWAPMPPPKPKGMAIAAMVLGIIAIPGSCCNLLNLIIATPAIVLGSVALGKANRGEAEGKGMAMAGIICGVIGLILGAIAFVVFGIFGDETTRWLQQHQYYR